MFLYRYLIVLFFLFVFLVKEGYAQTDTLPKLLETPVQSILKLPVRGLRGLEIVSASKKSESIFDAPVAIAAITREEIQQAGALSIMEALRLLPGMIVREVSSGNYDINVRGLNNMPPGSDFYAADNSNTLVMIDNRPIYNYFSGGTFWEALPIDIHDIERIELVRGASSALYGSNAVTGVIHIITRKLNREGFSTSGNLEYGSLGTVRASASGGYAPSPKLQVMASFNYTQRKRTTDEFYSLVSQRYLNPINSAVGIPSYQIGSSVIKGYESVLRKYPQLDVSMDRYGFNTFFNYTPNTNVSIDATLGLEDSYSVRTFAENRYTPLSAMTSQTKYIDLRSRLKDGDIQLSYWFGKQRPGIEAIGAAYDFGVLDLQADYNLTWKRFNLKPSFSYRNSIYDDSKYFTNQDVETGLISGRKGISIISPSMRLDYTHKNLRLIAAALYSKFSTPDAGYLSYQLIGTYKVKEKHIFRAVYAQANRGAFITQIFANYRSALRQTSATTFTYDMVSGNENLTLMTSKSVEIGYRFQAQDKLSIDVDFFRSDAKDYGALIARVDNINEPTRRIQRRALFQTKIPARGIQRGVTLTFAYNFSSKLQTRLFFTLQQTEVKDYSPSNFDVSFNPTINYLVLSNIDNYKGTPRLYGGFVFNYAINKFNINLNGYYFDQQELTHISDSFLNRPSIRCIIESKLLLNLKVGYRPFKQFLFYANVRNILQQDTFEYYFTDRVGSTVSGGINYDF
ncbi:TonB-dependent receptor plug domain-containing protein [Thermoflexibacter ruber]|uniref:Iron complex outermembrane recepter protein n=1 Tax=Thermoflexibacter ruber TaxID=1003 RepID=A0A1I2I0P7_9BACT|nr:TonB-dependent receptor plug domain-containing protein [Thermoflexibacter ruber]SFF34466.1 iron complex outermembrane recepter protein [Thermoflexibacter ruber]